MASGAPPPPPAAVEPTLEPTPEPTPLKEPVFTLDLEYLKERQGIGSWFEFIEFLQWKADDKTLVTETPKIKIVFRILWKKIMKFYTIKIVLLV